jgi:hypothetical protein
MLALLALAACAGPSPDLTPTDADTAAPASAADAAADGSAGEAAAEAAAVSAETPEDPAAASSATAVAPARVEPSAPPAEPAPVEPPAPPAEPSAETETPPADTAEEPPPAEPVEAAAAPDSEPAEAVAEPAAEPLPPAPVEEQPALAAVAPSGGWFAPEPSFGLASDRPYVVIRFTDDAGDYQPALAEAVRRAVARRPDVAFDLVAVTPRASNADDLADDKGEAAAQAAGVMKALADLGIGPDRVTMRAWTGQPTDVNEIRLYIR